jgi:hypothetical protein
MDDYMSHNCWDQINGHTFLLWKAWHSIWGLEFCYIAVELASKLVNKRLFVNKRTKGMPNMSSWLSVQPLTYKLPIKWQGVVSGRAMSGIF